MSTLRLSTALVAIVLAVGCTGKDSAPAGDDDDDGTSWAPIISAEWQLDPNSEITSDIHVVTLDRDYYVGAIRPIAPPGTHHTVLARGASFDDIIYASGLGTGELVFPPGVGLHLSAGEALFLQLHLFNVEATPLSGTSGVEILEIEESDVVDEADVFLPGPFDMTLPPSQSWSMSDTCDVASEMSFFAVIPHMHQMGTHFRLAATAAGLTTTLHDDDYSFSNQTVYPFESPVALAAGDSLEIECTWNNTTTDPVSWGESSTTEMCFAILFRYPAQEEEFCTQHP